MLAWEKVFEHKVTPDRMSSDPDRIYMATSSDPPRGSVHNAAGPFINISSFSRTSNFALPIILTGAHPILAPGLPDLDPEEPRRGAAGPVRAQVPRRALRLPLGRHWAALLRADLWPGGPRRGRADAGGRLCVPRSLPGRSGVLACWPVSHPIDLMSIDGFIHAEVNCPIYCRAMDASLERGSFSSHSSHFVYLFLPLFSFIPPTLPARRASSLR